MAANMRVCVSKLFKVDVFAGSYLLRRTTVTKNRWRNVSAIYRPYSCVLSAANNGKTSSEVFDFEKVCRKFSLSCPIHSDSCWKCGHQVKRNHFCAECGVVQPSLDYKNHFEVMGVQEHFDLDLPTLTANFKQLQWKLHPDKFANKSETEQQYALDQSSQVNQAYRTLQSPLRRCLYMLELHGEPLEEGEIHMDSAFLMDIMEVNERVAESSSPEELKDIGKKAKSDIQELLDRISVALGNRDYGGTKLLAAHLKYHVNIEEKVLLALERLNS